MSYAPHNNCVDFSICQTVFIINFQLPKIAKRSAVKDTPFSLHFYLERKVADLKPVHYGLNWFVSEYDYLGAVIPDNEPAALRNIIKRNYISCFEW